MLKVIQKPSKRSCKFETDCVRKHEAYKAETVSELGSLESQLTSTPALHIVGTRNASPLAWNSLHLDVGFDSRCYEGTLQSSNQV